jgi:prepilin peptidase CpaA
MPTWTYLFLVCLLAAALWSDLKGRRIPNGLIAIMLTLGVALQYTTSGAAGVLNGLTGLVLGSGAFLLLYAGGGMGAGDVKLMGASGLFLGPGATIVALIYTLIFGGMLALAKLVSRGLNNGASTHGPGIPYAPAIGAGVVTALVQIH